ncbi:hypothetical protein [Halomarina rubra]|uniref:Nudix hydrolase domain-containing protein n=1 Tax=Halomarina rubra TaxID=2071873 RepID=A0ABD6AVI2_9EURY|nr:hypothetical protein [Halomarina rubra]
MDALTDPETLRSRADVAFVEKPPEVHQDHYDLYDPIAGMAVAGVTDDDGRLLLLQLEDAPIPTMPYGKVSPGDDWVETVREAVHDATDVAVTVDGVRRVRSGTYRSEDGEETTGYDVVFAASPESDRDCSEATGLSCQREWSARWADPAGLDLPDAEGNDVVADIRLFR